MGRRLMLQIGVGAGVALGLALAVALGPRSAQTTGSGADRPTVSVTATPGQSDIAAGKLPDGGAALGSFYQESIGTPAPTQPTYAASAPQGGGLTAGGKVQESVEFVIRDASGRIKTDGAAR